MKSKSVDEQANQYSEAETVRRREATLKRMLSTPHKPHEPLKAAKKKSNKRKLRK